MKFTSRFSKTQTMSFPPANANNYFTYRQADMTVVVRALKAMGATSKDDFDRLVRDFVRYSALTHRKGIGKVRRGIIEHLCSANDDAWRRMTEMPVRRI